VYPLPYAELGRVSSTPRVEEDANWVQHEKAGHDRSVGHEF
jgi:hypothetical protein